MINNVSNCVNNEKNSVSDNPLIFSEKEIYLSNESFSKHQCWIEGSLLMAKDVLKMIGISIEKVFF